MFFLEGKLGSDMFVQDGVKNTMKGLQDSSRILRKKHPDLGQDKEISHSFEYPTNKETIELFKDNNTRNSEVSPTPAPPTNDLSL